MQSQDPFAKPQAQDLNESKLGELAQLANLMKLHERRVEQLEDELKGAKKNLAHVQEETIPSLMQELGLSSIVLDDGTKLTTTTTIYASIPKATHDQAMNWIIENGHQDLIKLNVSGTFGKEEYDLARAVYERLEKEGAKVVSKEGVHPSTLRSFIKEQLEHGMPVPLELFGARPVTKAKLS